MKLIRFGEPGNEKPGIYLNEKRYDLSAWIKDYDESFFAADGIKQLRRILKEQSNLPEANTKAKWASPVARPSKIICIGLNYADHARETNAQIPKEPIIFFKSTTALSGPYDDVIIPKNSKKTDWEVEFAVVIGKKTSYADEGNAMDYVA